MSSAESSSDNNDDVAGDEGFNNYVAKTVDTGPGGLVVTTVVSLTALVLIPFFMRVGEKLRAHRKHRRRKQEEKRDCMETQNVTTESSAEASAVNPAVTQSCANEASFDSTLISSPEMQSETCGNVDCFVNATCFPLDPFDDKVSSLLESAERVQGLPETLTPRRTLPWMACWDHSEDADSEPDYKSCFDNEEISRSSSTNSESDRNQLGERNGILEVSPRASSNMDAVPDVCSVWSAPTSVSSSESSQKEVESPNSFKALVMSATKPGNEEKVETDLSNFATTCPRADIDNSNLNFARDTDLEFSGTSIRSAHSQSISKGSQSGSLRDGKYVHVDCLDMGDYLTTNGNWKPRHLDQRKIEGAGEAVKELLSGNINALEDRIGDNEDGANSGNCGSSFSEEKEETAIFANQETGWRRFKFYHFDSEMLGIVKLAVPYTVRAVAFHIFNVMEFAVIGRLLGTTALSAYVVVQFCFAISVMFINGALTSLFTLCSQSVGAGNCTLAGQYVQIAILFYQVIWIPFGVFWLFLMDDAAFWLGFDQDVADEALSFTKVGVALYFFQVYRRGVGYLLDVIEHENYVAVMNILQSVIRFLIILIMAEKNRLDLFDVGLIQLSVEILFIGVEVAVQIHTGWLADYWHGMIGTLAFCNWKAVQGFLKLSIPMSLGFVLTYGEWELLTILAGFMGSAEVTAWGLLGNFWEALEAVTLSVSDAGEVRVAFLLASNQPVRARNVANKALFLGVFVAALYSIPIFFLRDKLPYLFTTDETLQNMMEVLIPYVCLGNISLMFGSMCWAILGAQGRYPIATLMGFVGSWLVTLPLSVVLTIPLKLDLQGLAGAVVIGYSYSGALNASIVMRSNWLKLSDQVRKGSAEDNNGATASITDAPGEVNYDDYYWKELPEFVRSAAMVLGYNRIMWDMSLQTHSSEMAWENLKPEQQEAAGAMGYNKEKWNAS